MTVQKKEREKALKRALKHYRTQEKEIATSVRPTGVRLTATQGGDQVYKRIAYESIIGTAQAAIAAMTNHRGICTRPSTLSIDQGRSAN